MKRFLLFCLLPSMCVLTIYSQGFDYSDRQEIGNGLTKVKSGGYSGIIDQDGQVVVSVEYQDIIYREGKALLIKNDHISGYIDTSGIVHPFSNAYYVHSKYKFIFDEMIPVTIPIQKQQANAETLIKYGFIKTDGDPFKVTTRIKGIKRRIGKRPTMFDDILPFSDGIASVYVKKEGWKHIDKEGKERFVFDDKRIKPLFRSSVYNNQCLIVTKDGIRECQESADYSAMIKRVLSDEASLISVVEKDGLIFCNFGKGIIVLDSIGRAIKYKNDLDSIVYIEQEKHEPILIDSILPLDTLSLEKDIKINVTPRTLQADSQGQANTIVEIHNESNIPFDSITISILCNSIKRERKGTLDAKTTLSIPLYIPAKFSTNSISRTIIVTLTYKEQAMELKIPVTIMRYNPSRSR